MSKNIKLLLKELKIPYHNLNHYELAFTHSSFNADAHTFHKDYERLEFLGDSILGFIVASYAYNNRPDLSQGDLTKLRSALVKTHSLANYARKLKLYEYIKVGSSYSNSIEKSDSVLEDVFESFIAAIYLDLGLKFTKKFIENIFGDDIIKFDISMVQDYKSRLQEEMQAEYRESVKYEVVEESGPAHKKHFKVCVMFENMVLGCGEGSSKKEAEINAAKDALTKRVGV